MDAFVGGQTSEAARRIVDRFLDERRDLPTEVRRNVLIARDEPDLTVRIGTAAASVADANGSRDPGRSRPRRDAIAMPRQRGVHRFTTPPRR